MTRVISLADVFSSWCPNIPMELSKEKFEKLTEKETHGVTLEEYNDDVKRWWKPIEEKYGFRLRVVVSKDIPARHSTFSWIRGMGVSKYDEIFQGDVHLPSDWLLAFPERHCSLEETRQLIHQMCKLNKAQKGVMKKLDIITSSPYIISDTMRDCISIISFPNGKVTYNQDYMSF